MVCCHAQAVITDMELLHRVFPDIDADGDLADELQMACAARGTVTVSEAGILDAFQPSA
jgi:hypothetical protein